MIAIFHKTTATQTGNARCKELLANLQSAQSAVSQATDRADIKELRSRVKVLRRQIRKLNCEDSSR